MLFLRLLSCAVLATAQQPKPPADSSCAGQCKQKFEAAWLKEAKVWHNIDDDPFYDISENLKGHTPGDLLRWQDVDETQLATEFTIPAGMSLSRAIYVSEDPDGNAIPASLFVLLPFAPPNPHTKLDVIVWAHGTAGWDRHCAPSNHANLFYGWLTPYSLVQAGYAVIAPDYAGLGSKIPQGFVYQAANAHASDVAFSVIAARKALAHIMSDGWVVIGHSEGGAVAWATNEKLTMEGKSRFVSAGRFLGAVSVSPSRHLISATEDNRVRLNVSEAQQSDASGSGIFLIYLLQSLAAIYPRQILLREILTEVAFDRLKLSNSSCVIAGEYLYNDLSYSEIFKDTSWLNSPEIHDWAERYQGIGTHALAAPMLVVQSSDDEVVDAVTVEAKFNETCSKFPESRMAFVAIKGITHDATAEVGQQSYLQWVKDRFEGKDAARGCSKTLIQPVRQSYNRYATTYISDATV